MRKKTHEEFVQETFEKYGDEYAVLGSYNGSKIPVEMRHNKCDWIFRVIPNDFLGKRSGCPYCIPNSKMNGDLFKRRVYDLVGEVYTVLDEYVNTMTKVTIIHNVCGTVFNPTPHNFLHSGSRCPECAKEIWGEKNRKLPDEFEKEFNNLWSGEYTLLDRYELSNKRIRVLHNSNLCNNHVFLANPNNLIDKKSGCPKCANNQKSNTLEFKHRVFNLVGDEYLVLGNYVDTHTKILMKHNKCGFTYDVAPDKFLNQGRRCPKCKESKGEKLIFDYLQNHQFIFERERKFDDCKHKNRLSFDFIVENKDGSILCAIEFDGEQHFISKPIFGGDKGLALTKQRDEIKNVYCQANGIPLLRIPYWEIDNIEQILDEKLQSLMTKC